MENRPPLRIGIVGVGALTVRAVLPHLTQPDVSDRVSVSALCDPVVERARTVAEQYGVPHVYGSLSDMLAEDAVDAVTIASPIGLHHAHAKEALTAGKHVHVNKTMTTTVAEADELIALAAGKDLRIVASPGEVLRSQLSTTRRLIREGAIGDVAWAICGCAFEDYHEEEPERTSLAGGAIDPSWYFRKPGGGPVYDMTSYALHQLTSVLGPARRVTAMSGTRVRDRAFMGRSVTIDADDNTILLLDFGGDVFAIAYGTAAGAPNEQFGAVTFYGTKGVIDGVLLNGEPFDFPGRDKTLEAPVTDWETQMRVLPHVTGAHEDIPESHVFEDIMQMVRWVREGVPSAANAEHARHVIDIIESGYRAAETGATQDLATSFTLPTD
ncbi:MAG: Myo-inositol 2-dehydrogenase [uncultured Nocardioidaceae bacterium]|uniref:Myo-inositol 2-dehydrogenase n=1 Tax=uncultured Nocardioidaceae bacterium TaxID=253824 RepID=A0A6J4L214_9ACTN|nr:MAG: Myo-inositol 2-dehydrogenase [uncultured Nocardioidaceae bacterium]